MGMHEDEEWGLAVEKFNCLRFTATVVNIWLELIEGLIFQFYFLQLQIIKN